MSSFYGSVGVIEGAGTEGFENTYDGRLENNLTASITVGGIEDGKAYYAGTKIERILKDLLSPSDSTGKGNIENYYTKEEIDEAIANIIQESTNISKGAGVKIVQDGTEFEIGLDEETLATLEKAKSALQPEKIEALSSQGVNNLLDLFSDDPE